MTDEPKPPPPPPPTQVQFQAAWIGVEEERVQFVNQFLSQIDDGGEAVLALGQATPPVVLGTPEEQLRQMQAIPFVQIRPVVRVSLSARRIRQLITVLEETLKQQEKAKQILEERERQ